MKAHPELLSIGLLTICVCMSILKTGAWAQTRAPFNQATYFTFRMEQLKEELKFTPEQQRQAKYVVEQETAELMQYACNPTTSRKDKLAQLRMPSALCRARRRDKLRIAGCSARSKTGGTIR